MKRSRTPSIESIRRAGNCTTCRATGQVPFSTDHWFEFVPCPACEGTGRA